ncbi:MAG: hypothetical protein KKA42_15835 [candidate division Zixibacteria bacterium]|nr:hypothetical protein [candidate division Zixibacteria bacterium]
MHRGLLLLLLGVLGLLAGCSDDEGESPPLPVAPVEVTVLRVPADYPTLQTAIDSADIGDTVLVASGVYRGDGNRDLHLDGKNLVIMSEHGPKVTVIDCEGDTANLHGGIVFSGQDSTTVLFGFTITGARTSQGAAIRCDPRSSPRISYCVLADNVATVSGGAIRCKGGTTKPHFINCTIVRNAAPVGGGLFLIAGASPVLENCIVAFSLKGEAVDINDNTCEPVLSCCNLFGNSSGDWIDDLAHQRDHYGNLCADPLFVDTANANYVPYGQSPCAPANNSCGVLVGALEAL